MAYTPCVCRGTHTRQATAAVNTRQLTHAGCGRTDLVFIHDHIRDFSKLLEVLGYVALRDLRLDAAHEHAVLLLHLPGGPDRTQGLVFSPFDVLIQAGDCRGLMKDAADEEKLQHNSKDV